MFSLDAAGTLRFHPATDLAETTASAVQRRIRSRVLRIDARQGAHMDDQAKLHRAACVLLARLLIVYGTDAPQQLRRVADELEGLWEELNGDSTVPVLSDFRQQLVTSSP